MADHRILIVQPVIGTVKLLTAQKFYHVVLVQISLAHIVSAILIIDIIDTAVTAAKTPVSGCLHGITCLSLQPLHPLVKRILLLRILSLRRAALATGFRLPQCDPARMAFVLLGTLSYRTKKPSVQSLTQRANSPRYHLFYRSPNPGDSSGLSSVTLKSHNADQTEAATFCRTWISRPPSPLRLQSYLLSPLSETAFQPADGSLCRSLRHTPLFHSRCLLLFT